MMTASCPNCGKPIRPGAKFCGYCGTTLAAAQDSVCPHCGKPVRPSARFCNHCGETIERAGAVPGAPGKAQPAVPGTIEGTRPSRQAAAEAMPPKAAPAKPGAAPPPRRYRYLPWLILIAILFCGVAAVAGVWFINPGNILGRATETPTAAPTETATPTPVTLTEAPAIPPTFTPTLAPATETQPATPTDTSIPEEVTPDITATVTSTITSTIPATITPTGTLEPPVTGMILEDQFDSTLALNWRVWGSPRPIIEHGFGDNYLSLTATNTADAGVTSKIDFPLNAGVEMSFGAQLQPGYTQYTLIFNWDPPQFVREPGNNEPGILQVEISINEVVVRAALTNDRCEAPVRGSEAHDYLLRVLEEKSVALHVDESTEPVCTLTDIGLEAPITGRVTFRGMGLVTRVLVAGK